MLKLHVIIASTRPGRIGLPVGTWFVERAKSHAKFEVTTVDLAEIKLPLLDEPKHPKLEQYEHAHTKAWSAIVRAADAFVIVTPEYNYSMPPSLLNAFDYLYNEWSYKPAAFVSYGGASGGMRSVEHAKHVATTLKLVPIVEAVAIPFAMKSVADGKFQSTDALDKSAGVMLDELLRWAEALRPMRG